MSRILSDKPDDDGVSQPGSWGLFIDGVPCTNSAAKFWCSLIDEAAEDFPDCDRIDFVAPTTIPLSHDLLYPEMSLKKDIERLAGRSMEDVFREALAELDLFGPPAPVSIRLLSGTNELLAKELPTDCLDAEIFPFLVVWLLQWLRIPESSWNDEILSGRIVAENFQGTFQYDISLNLKSEHLSEGLYRRTVMLRFKRENQVD